MRAALLVAAITTLVFVGCGPTTVSGKKAAAPASNGITELVKALRSNNPRQAYDLLSVDSRREITFDEFALMWKKTKPEREYQARALEEGLKGNPDLGERSKVVYRDGKSVILIREDGVWKLDDALVDESHAGSPHDAVRLFAEALAGRNYEALMRVLSNRRREGISKQVNALADSLIRNLEGDVDLVGENGAEMRWEDDGKRYRLVLKKEGDEWRIDDIHVLTAPPAQKKPPRRKPRRK